MHIGRSSSLFRIWFLSIDRIILPIRPAGERTEFPTFGKTGATPSNAWKNGWKFFQSLENNQLRSNQNIS
jgi:hypothetical protein